MAQTAPEAFERVAIVPLVEELMVMVLPELPDAENVPLIVVVADAGKVTVFGALIVKLLKVLAPVKITAPVPPLVIEML